MTGTNELHLNEQTVCEALEYWLTNKVLNPNEAAPKVIGFDKGESYGTGFVVKLQTPPLAEPGKETP